MVYVVAIFVLLVLGGFWRIAGSAGERLEGSADPNLRAFGSAFANAVGATLLLLGLCALGAFVFLADR